MFKDFTKYEVYEDGRIWSYKSNKWLKPCTTENGYQRVGLTDNEGNRKMYLLHRVVWEAVTRSTIPPGYEINHRSEVKTENMITNLELVSHKDNVNYGSRTQKCSKQVGAFKNNELVMSFQSTAEAGRQGFCQTSVAACCNGKRKTHKGFTWKYI